jgi:hypothetical protein
MPNKTAPYLAMYAAVIRTDGREWIAGSMIGHDPGDIRQQYTDLARRIPDWAAENKLQRVARVTVKELPAVP